MQAKALDLMDKAFSHTRGNPSFFQLTIDKIDDPIQRIKPLPVSTFDVSDTPQGKNLASTLLSHHGLPHKVIKKAMNLLESKHDSQSAHLINAKTGERLDDREKKGVRVSLLDWEKENFEKWCNQNKLAFNQRMKEALTLATKVCSHPLTVAELCWSDDPDYITGYVASPARGYQRITQLKEYGDEVGGRIFFIDSDHPIDSYIHFLEEMPVLIEMEENDGFN